MAKDIKGDPRRKPPEPADHLVIEAWFDTLMPYVQPLVRSLDELICTAIPNLHYAVKFKRAFYGLRDLGWIIELAPYAVSVNVFFLGGADFDPPPQLGSADRTRYIKITSTDEATMSELLNLVSQARRTPGWA